MSHKDLRNKSVTCETTVLIELLNDTQFQEIEYRHVSNHISIQGSLQSYYSLQILLTAITQLRIAQPDLTVFLKVKIAFEQNPFKVYFTK